MKMTDVIAALDAGDSIIITHKRPDMESDRQTYCLKSSGKTVGVRAFRRLLKDEKIAPEEDGLPGLGISQTYRKSGS